MAVIGQFTKTEQGYQGYIKTLELSFENVTITKVENKSQSKSPDYEVFVEKACLGGGWIQDKKVFDSELVRISLDDPSMSEPLYASLMKAGKDKDGFNLVWSRSRK